MDNSRINNQKNLNVNLYEFMNTTSIRKISSYKFTNLLYLAKNGYYQALHHKICQYMFDLAEKEKELWIRIDEQEDVITPENIENYFENIDGEKKYYRVSMITKTMLDYDRMMLNLILEENAENVIRENRYASNMYRPYFFNFLIDISETDRKYIEFLANPENVNQWFVGTFNDSDREEGRIFPGYIERIASPAVYKEHKICITDKRLSSEKLKSVNDVYDLGPNPCAGDTDVNKELDEVLEKPEFKEIKIYNVGNGNCIYLKGRNSFGGLRVLYDIGYYCTIPTKNVKNKKYMPTVQAIRHLKPHCVILSHWDSDHFYGCAYAGMDIFRCKWFAPNSDGKSSISAKRVAKYLQALKHLILVDRSSGRKIAGVQGPVSKLELFIGEKKKGKDKKITGHNKEGLILSLVNEKWEYIRSLMLGDVPYESIPTGIMFAGNTPYDYLIVPHHGAEMDTGLLSSATGKQNGYAIICAKPKRPNAVHKKALEKNGYITMTTGDAGRCIDINLSRKDFPRKRP